MTSNSCHTGGFPRYFDVLSSFASRHQTATEGEVQGGEGGTGGGFAETGTDPPNRILTPPNSSHPPLLASGIPQTGDPVSYPQGTNFVELCQVEMSSMNWQKLGLPPRTKFRLSA